MERRKKFRMKPNDVRKFKVAVCGSHQEFTSFCRQCKSCEVKCNPDIFLNCINSNTERVIVFKNKKEANAIMQEMLFF